MIKRDYIYLAFIAVLVIVILFLQKCNSNDADKLVNEITQYKTEAQIYKTKHGLEIAENKALALQTQSQLKTMLATNDTLKEWINKFKKITAGVIIKENTIIKEVAVPFDKLIPCDFKPFKANRLEKFFQFYSTIANTGLTIDSLKIPNEQKIVVGQRGTGFLKLKKSLVVDVNNSNPYIVTSNIAGYVYTPKKTFLERPLVTFGIGAVSGFVAGRATR